MNEKKPDRPVSRTWSTLSLTTTHNTKSAAHEEAPPAVTKSVIESSLVVQCRVPEGCQVGDHIAISLPAGGTCTATCPSASGKLFRVIVPRTQLRERASSPSSPVEVEVEDEEAVTDEEEFSSSSSSSSSSCSSSTECCRVPLEAILSDERRKLPHLLEWLAGRTGDGVALLMLYLECEHHHSIDDPDQLKLHERSVYETYVRRGSPKFACARLANVTARLTSRQRRPALGSVDALSVLQRSVREALRREYDDFSRKPSSEAYRAMLREASKEAPYAAVTLDDLSASSNKSERPLRARRRVQRYVRAFCDGDGERALRWWRRLDGRLSDLCRRVATIHTHFNTSSPSSPTNAEGEVSPRRLGLRLSGQKSPRGSASPSGSPPRHHQQLMWRRQTVAAPPESKASLHGTVQLQVLAELRRAAQRLAARPPSAADGTIVDAESLERLAELAKQNHLDAAAPLYAEIFAEIAKQISTWLERKLLEPFRNSQLAAELRVAEADEARTGEDRFALEEALRNIAVRAFDDEDDDEEVRGSTSPSSLLLVAQKKKKEKKRLGQLYIGDELRSFGWAPPKKEEEEQEEALWHFTHVFAVAKYNDRRDPYSLSFEDSPDSTVGAPTEEEQESAEDESSCSSTTASSGDDGVDAAIVLFSLDAAEAATLCAGMLLERPIVVRARDARRRGEVARMIAKLAESLVEGASSASWTVRAQKTKRGEKVLLVASAQSSRALLTVDVDARTASPAIGVPSAAEADLRRALRSAAARALQLVHDDDALLIWRKPFDPFLREDEADNETKKPPSHRPDVAARIAVKKFVDRILRAPLRLHARSHHVGEQRGRRRLACFSCAHKFLATNSSSSMATSATRAFYIELFTTRRFADALYKTCFGEEAGGATTHQSSWSSLRDSP